MAKTHELKILPEYFAPVKEGKKTFEIRKNDRDFKVGDTLILKEIYSNSDKFTGREVTKKITYITDYAQLTNHVVMAIV